MGKIFTKQINNSSLVLASEDGINNLSVKNNSATAQDITITGTLSINGLSSSAITLAMGDVATIASDTPLDGITITSASVSALADIMAAQ
jgi:hypothetical protein